MKKLFLTAMILLMATTLVAGEKAEWTVLVYLAADNNLEQAGYQNIYEMSKIGSSKDLNIVCLFDDQKKDEAYMVKVNRNEEAAANRLSFKNWDLYKDSACEVTTIDEVNTGDPEVMYSFISKAAEKYPANRYFLLFWNHGSGFYTVSHSGAAESGSFEEEEETEAPVTDGRFSKDRIQIKPKTSLDSIAYDDNSGGDSLTQIELKAVFNQLKEESGILFDIIGFDACLMNNVEVVSQLSSFSKMVIGSEESEPGAGWDYEGFLKPMRENPAISLEDLSEALCKTYVKKNSKGLQNKIRFLMSPMPLTLAASDTVKIGEVEVAVDNLSKAMINNLQKNPQEAVEAFTKAQASSQTYSYKFYVDLADLCKNISKYSKDSMVKKAASAVVKSIKGTVLNNETKYTRGSHGLTVFFPSFDVPMSALKAYKLLDFSAKTHWDDMLALLMRKLPKVEIGNVYRMKASEQPDGKYRVLVDLNNKTRSREVFNISAKMVQFEGSFAAKVMQKTKIKELKFENNPVNAELKANVNPRIDFVPVLDSKMKSWVEKNQDQLSDLSMKLVVSLDNGYVLAETPFRYSTVLGINAKMRPEFPEEYLSELFGKIDAAIEQAGLTPENPQYAGAMGGVFNQIKGSVYSFFFQYPGEVELGNIETFMSYLNVQKTNTGLSINSKVILALFVQDLQKTLGEIMMSINETSSLRTDIQKVITKLGEFNFLQ